MCAIALLAGVAAASAQDRAREDRYIATRDAFVDKLKRADKAGKLDDALLKQEEGVRADLEQQLRAILGPVAIAGIAVPGKLNFDTLYYSDVGFGALDGLQFATDDDKTHVVVTTQPLFARWLSAHRTWWEHNNVPQNAAAALKTESFYTQAMSADAAVMKFADLPLARNASASFAAAMLAARSQDQTPPVPDEIFVAAIQGGRVFVAWAAAEAAVGPIAACDAVRADSDKKADDAFAAYQASGLKNEKLLDRSTKLREQGDTAFRRCFGAQAPKHAAFAAAAKQAQALYERLPAR